MMKKLKKWWQNLIDAIAQENKSAFGSGSLDCCDLKEHQKK